MKNQNEKKTLGVIQYLKPKIERVFINQECGIASGSTELRVGDNSGNVLIEDWDEGNDFTDSINW